jgi:two-component system, NarL family, response regulator NreC
MAFVKSTHKCPSHVFQPEFVRKNRAGRMIQLVLVDDHRITLDAFRLYISTQRDFEVRTFLNEEFETIQKLKRNVPDVVLVNMRMRNPSGPAATRLLLSTVPQVKVIGFGNLDDRDSILSMLRVGVCGFVSQRSSLSELSEAVRTVTRGGSFMSSSVSKLLVEEFTKNKARPTKADTTLKLTDCEERILTLIADGRSNKEMAAAMAICVRTVEKYREHLMAKLQIKTVAGLTKFAIRKGLSTLD